MLKKKWIVRSRAWISILLMLPFAVAAILSHPLFEGSSGASIAYQAAGWTLFLLGAFWRWWATLYIGGQKGEVLVCEGPYSLCRNPLYLGTFLIVMAIALLIQSALFAVGVSLATLFYLFITVRDEERRLEARFGKAFLAYRSQVPMFLPQFKRYHSGDRIEVQVIGLRAEFFRSLRWCWVPFLCNLLFQLRLNAWWPHYFRLP